MLARFFSRTVALTFSLLAIRFAGLDDLSANAAPTRLFRRIRRTMPTRFCFRSVTLRASRPNIPFRELNHFSVHADPAISSSATTLARFLFGAESLTASRAALSFSRLDNLSIDAAPKERRWP